MFLNHFRTIKYTLFAALISLAVGACGGDDTAGAPSPGDAGDAEEGDAGYTDIEEPADGDIEEDLREPPEGECPDGFVDLDERIEGCECEITDPEDPIDEEGLDENCDGVDGVLEDTIFVSPRGSDSVHIDDDTSLVGLLPDKPVRTLKTALELAKARDRQTILLAGGRYEGAVELEEGISIHGGYNVYFTAREQEYEESVIEAIEDDFSENTSIYVTLSAEGVEKETSLSYLTIKGYDAENASGSTLAVHAVNSGGLKLHNIELEGGKASDGKDGEDGEELDADCTAATGGAGGLPDDNVKPCNHSSYEDSEANAGAKGRFGENNDNAGDGGEGGEGGINRCQDEHTRADSGEQGERGESGQNGADGHYSDEDDIGSFADAENGGWWRRPFATLSEDGGDGGGGGGGGAGGNFQHGRNGDLYVGGAGTDGGAGGCGGPAGQNGESGGSSFGLAVVGQPIELRALTISLGQAGDGGRGGVGQNGTHGENAENVDSSGGGAARGSRGGPGGRGGSGGHGAGGHGGHAIGLASADAQQDVSEVTVERGEVRKSRQGRAQVSGPDDGSDGLVEEVYEF